MSTPLTQQPQPGYAQNIRFAAEELIVDYFRQAIAQAPATARPRALPQPGMAR
jgi:hypothetical protein